MFLPKKLEKISAVEFIHQHQEFFNQLIEDKKDLIRESVEPYELGVENVNDLARHVEQLKELDSYLELFVEYVENYE